MDEPHDLFKEPADTGVRIWRYLDFTKFVAMLDGRSLYFTRSDLLGDPFEGSFSRANERLRPVVYGDLLAKYPELGRIFKHDLPRIYEWTRTCTFISCWHLSDGESAAMWKLYSGGDHSVAIRSTFARLRGVLAPDIQIGLVSYIDYESDWLFEGNMYSPFLHKRKSFEHERELRAIIQKLPTENGEIATGKTQTEEGVAVPVDLDRLIETVFVSPAAPAWFRDLVERVTRRYGLQRTAVRSSLDQAPVY